MTSLEEGQIVMCTVEKIVGTTVFVKIEGDGDGTIITSEIAPGRIRNLRDYVVPNKKIVCKVLRIDQKGHVDLSLRRVTSKEKKQALEALKKEKSLRATLKTITKNAEQIIEKIKQKHDLADFFELAKETPDILKKFFSSEESEKLTSILKQKKEKQVSVKKKFSLTSESGNGITKIKSILPPEASYTAAGKYLITIKDKNYKDANHKLDSLLDKIEEKAKKQGCVFAITKTKQK